MLGLACGRSCSRPCAHTSCLRFLAILPQEWFSKDRHQPAKKSKKSSKDVFHASCARTCVPAFPAHSADARLVAVFEAESHSRFLMIVWKDDFGTLL